MKGTFGAAFVVVAVVTACSSRPVDADSGQRLGDVRSDERLFTSDERRPAETPGDDRGLSPDGDSRSALDVATPEDGWKDVATTELATGTDVPTDTAEECSIGAQKCMDDQTAAICSQWKWVTAQVCNDEQLCVDGLCLVAEQCQPGHVKGCYSLAARDVCHASGKGYVPVFCTEGKKCMDGNCSELDCIPGVRQCVAPDSWWECLADGSGWTEPTPCDGGFFCVGGQCLNGCSGDIKYNMSNVGCEFWSVDLGQWDVKEGDYDDYPSASVIPHSVVVGNPNEVPATVTFDVGDGTLVEVADPVVPAGESRAFIMPVLSLQYTSITKKTIRLRTDHPVTAVQFNPPNNEDLVYTSDASLLYPISILGTEHYVVTTPSLLGIETQGYGKPPSVWGYVTVVAVNPGSTTVTIGPLSVATESGDGFPGHAEGDTFEVELDQWEVLHLARVS